MHTSLHTHRSQMTSSYHRRGSEISPVAMAVPCLNENRRLFPSSQSHDPWTLDLGSPTWPHLYCQTLDSLILCYKQDARAANISQMSVSGLGSAFIFVGFKLRAVWPLKWKLIGWKSNLRLGWCHGSHRKNPDSRHIKDDKMLSTNLLVPRNCFAKENWSEVKHAHILRAPIAKNKLYLKLFQPFHFLWNGL